MVIVKLYGGLGNQMYQYAAAKALSKRLKTKLYMDLDWFEEVKKTPELTLRHYELDGFGIKPKIISKADKLLLKIKPPTIFKEEFFGYSDGFNKLSGNVILDGYWQSYKYFEKYNSEIITAFHFPDNVKPENQKIIDSMKSCDSVALHVRRGDYNTKRGLEFHGLVPMDYYTKAVNEISKKVNRPKFFVFSDDIEWCRKNITLEFETIFIDSNSPNTGPEDMQLMASCKHMIIANSSFSWWAAWLNTNASKIIYAPTAWFKGVEHEINDRIPLEWKKI